MIINDDEIEVVGSQILTDLKKFLLNKKVEIYLNTHNDYTIIFRADNINYLFQLESECCSESWFSDIDNPEVLNGYSVTDIIMRNLDSYNIYDGRTRQVYDMVYGYSLVTGMGYCDIIFRNSSNGYYGGSMEYVTTLSDEELNNSYKQITSDWKA